MPKKHTVVEGDSIPSIAFNEGFFPETIWNLPENQELREKRKNFNVLMPGDIVFIPNQETKEITKSAENKHIFVRKGTPAIFRLQVFDVEEPLANQEYILSLDGKFIRGRTNAEGILQHSVPPNAKKGKLIFPDLSRPEIALDFGSLDPPEEISGIQKRLNNLGFYCGTPDNSENESLSKALTEFQRRFEIEETGIADEVTLAKLIEIHDKDELFPLKAEENTQEKGAIDNAFITG
jgi:N-acetylmuramoyl-L-alanine amidase